MAKLCAHCTGLMPVLARRHARFCSTRCRVAAHRRLAGVPAELAERSRWVRYSAAKVPLTAAGRAASSTNAATWCSYDRARASTAGVGVGFVLDGDGISCLDLDRCLVDGALAPWAAALLDRLPATYTEISPSGTGLHVWGHADVPHGRRIRNGGRAIEVYGTGRYITVTGRRWANTPTTLADLGDVMSLL